MRDCLPAGVAKTATDINSDTCMRYVHTLDPSRLDTDYLHNRVSVPK